MTWTQADEDLLNELEARKKVFKNNQFKQVELVASDIIFPNMFDHELAEGMIRHADRLVEALAPFCKKY
jgi:hypothetical protein